jgi:glucose/arabinose dehydrogenase
MTQVASFDLPWRIAFLPDGRMLVTEKVGRVVLVTQQGVKTELRGVPPSYYQGQNGMLGVFLSPHYATDHNVYLTYVEPGDYGGGLALGRGQLVLNGERPALDDFQVLWRQMPRGKRRSGGRADRVFAGRQIPLPHSGRSPADDSRPGSRPARGKNPAPDTGRQARARKIRWRAKPERRPFR